MSCSKDGKAYSINTRPCTRLLEKLSIVNSGTIAYIVIYIAMPAIVLSSYFEL